MYFFELTVITMIGILVINAVLLFSLVVMVRTAYMHRIYQKLRKEVLSDNYVNSMAVMRTYFREHNRSAMNEKQQKAQSVLRKVLGNVEAMLYFKFIPKHTLVEYMGGTDSYGQLVVYCSLNQ